MKRPLLPPRGIFTGTRILFDRELSAPVKETLLQIMALTWGSDSHTSPPLTYPLLEHLTGKTDRTLRGHLAVLRNYHAALRLQHAGPGQFIINLSGWLFKSDEPSQPQNGKVLPQPVKADRASLVDSQDRQSIKTENNHKEEEEFHTLRKEILPPPSDQSGQKKDGGKHSQHQTQLSGAVEKRLREAGVFPALLAEVAARAAEGKYKDKDLLALLAWCETDQPERPGGLFMGRLRVGARATTEYYSPACPRCGLRGRHGPECPRRYTEY
jgi:hypothetical protein